MATEFMYSHVHNPSMGSPYSHASYGGYTNGYGPKSQNGKSFAFRKRFERVDWRKLASLDINTISQTLDFTALQENIMNITFCNIEAELDLRMVDPNFIKLFKLAQLSIEYLLHSQEYLTGVIASLEEKIKKSQDEQNETKQSTDKLKQEMSEVKKESHKRKKLLMAQQQLIHAGSGSYNKCPFCSKAFLNGSFLQSHLHRRHGDQSVQPASVSVPTHQEPQKPSEFHVQMEELRERLHATESQLQHEKVKRKQDREKEKQRKLQPPVEGVNESEKEMYMKEISDVNKKYTDLEKVLNSQSKRSGLGELEDDIEVEKELLLQQREEVAMLKEELGAKVKSVESNVSNRFDKQEKKWQRKVQNLTRQHADDLEKMNDALEQTKKVLSQNNGGNISRQQQKEVDSILRKSKEQEEMMRSQDEIEELINEEHAMAAKSEVTPLKLGGHDKNRMSMMPSDDEDDETTENVTASHSLTQSMHSTYRSGELTLRTTQFLEELRKNPTLKVMRDELASLLQDHLHKIGIPPEMRGVPSDVLGSKLALLKTRRQTTIQKYPIFMEFRRQCNVYAEQQAREKLKAQKRSPATSPTGSRTTSPQRPQISVPLSQSQPTRGQRRAPQSAPATKASPSRSNQLTVPKPQPRPSSPQRTMQSTGTTSGGRTGSSVDWTSTQWDSDDDDSDESDDEPVFKHVTQVKSGPRNVSPRPKPRTSPHQPTVAPRTGPQVKTVMSKPLHDDEDNWDDDDDDSDMEALGFGKPVIQKSNTMPSRGPTTVQPKGQKVAELSRSIEFQLAGRKASGKPVGGVDVMSRAKNTEDDSDSNWDVSSVEDDVSPTRAASKKAPIPVRGSHASDTSNTYGTSVWGSSSKGASTVPPTSTAGRGLNTSVTDVSSDDELDLDNL